MATSKHRSGKSSKQSLQQEAAELQRSGERLPGVADLVKLYQQHAKTVERASAFQGHADRRIVITSGASSA